jgi:hypothetical protein
MTPKNMILIFEQFKSFTIHLSFLSLFDGITELVLSKAERMDKIDYPAHRVILSNSLIPLSCLKMGKTTLNTHTQIIWNDTVEGRCESGRASPAMTKTDFSSFAPAFLVSILINRL